MIESINKISMKQIKNRLVIKFGVLALSSFFLWSCSEDDNDIIDSEPQATCDDGIMNGDETGVDCGGSSCPSCEMTMSRRANLYATDKESGAITVFDLTNNTSITIETPSTAAEGIYYDSDSDEVVLASQSEFQLESYADISTFAADATVNISINATADLETPREIAVNDTNYVVADNAENKFFVYQKTTAGFVLTTTVAVPFPVWGITFKGNDLYAVVDKSSDLAVYYNFLANAMDGELAPSKRVTIEGIVRTHGLTYNGSDDIMILTDIGDAANTSDDGGFHVINNFSSKFDALSDGDVLPISMQTRVAGNSTLMGNPTDVAYDSETDAIYVSDVGTGKVLGFTSIGSGGDLIPTFNQDLNLVSSLYFSSDETDGNTGNSSDSFSSLLYSTSTANGNITVYDLLAGSSKTVTTTSMSSEGIYYSGLNDYVIQASRSNLMVEYFSTFSSTMNEMSISPDFSSMANVVSPREIAVYGNKVVVADNEADNDTFYVYSFDGNSFSLENTFSIGFKVWGITFKGNDLLAVVDNSSDLAVYSNFFDNISDGTLVPTKRITIEGIVRTHGIDYSEADDVLVITDIGEATNTIDDGGFHVIGNASVLLDEIEDGGTLALSNQIRFAGSATQMGNPIDVAYDHKTKSVFIAEIGNGKILGFSSVLTGGGNIVPSLNNDLESASSLYLYNN